MVLRLVGVWVGLNLLLVVVLVAVQLTGGLVKSLGRAVGSRPRPHGST